MYHRRLTAHLDKLERDEHFKLTFIHPIEAVALAVKRMQRSDKVPLRDLVSFDSQCVNYARVVGLMDCLDGNEPSPAGPLAGTTYSPLTTLVVHADVDRCNATVCGVFEGQIDSPRLVKRFSKVVGELHDNVASHACGRGYSASQVYRNKALCFAIADGGCGLRENAMRADPSISTDEGAVRWALQKGTTSAGRSLSGRRRRRADAQDFDDCYEHANHHQGLGLFELKSLVEETNGQLWLQSGTCEYRLAPGEEKYSISRSRWAGLIIEVKVPVDANVADRVDSGASGEDFGL